MKTKPWIFSVILVSILGMLLSSCSGLAMKNDTNPLKASGSITVTTIQVAPEVSGKITEIKAEKGQSVNAGDVLVVLDNQVQQAQLEQAQAAIDVAQSNLDAAQQKQASAQTQYDLAAQAARQQKNAANPNGWSAAQDTEIELPGWYFDQDEQITAVQAQVKAAQANLDTEKANLDSELKDASNSDFIAAEQRLAEAQQAYSITNQTFTEAKDAKSTKYLVDAAQKEVDAAKGELEAAQKAYDQMLTTDAADRVNEARARVAVAQKRLDNTQSTLDGLLTGDQSLQLKSAQDNLALAKSSVAQAEASLAQAKAAGKLAQLQLDKTQVLAPQAGIVLTRPMNPGEIAAAGADVIEIGSLDTVTLTVYIPENEYGRIHLGQKTLIQVDSFPGKDFEGSVSYISDEAEYTPRNVQTVESRSTTVYRVEITLPNPDLELKPGMPADATFVNE